MQTPTIAAKGRQDPARTHARCAIDHRDAAPDPSPRTTAGRTPRPTDGTIQGRTAALRMLPARYRLRQEDRARVAARRAPEQDQRTSRLHDRGRADLSAAERPAALSDRRRWGCRAVTCARATRAPPTRGDHEPRLRREPRSWGCWPRGHARDLRRLTTGGTMTFNDRGPTQAHGFVHWPTGATTSTKCWRLHRVGLADPRRDGSNRDGPTEPPQETSSSLSDRWLTLAHRSVCGHDHPQRDRDSPEE